jgi:hypothetical protein
LLVCKASMPKRKGGDASGPPSASQPRAIQPVHGPRAVPRAPGLVPSQQLESHVPVWKTPGLQPRVPGQLPRPLGWRPQPAAAFVVMPTRAKWSRPLLPWTYAEGVAFDQRTKQVLAEGERLFRETFALCGPSSLNEVGSG